MSSRIPRVALLIETSRAYGRGLLRGVRRYIAENGPWSVFFRPRGLGEPPPPWLASWHGDGILVRADTRRLAQAVRACRVPTVDLRLSFRDLGWPTVGIDNRAIVELAVQHLADQGLRHFGFCGLRPGENVWMDYRAECFAEAVAKAGHSGSCFPPATTRRRARGVDEEQQALAAWLTGLPKPVGVMACNDDRGLEVLEACRRAGLHVPDEVAVIGVDNDEMLCGLSDPPLSSVDVGVERAGYEAAALLDRLMRGQKAPAQPLMFAPYGVVVRRSTEILTVDDPDLKELIRFIRENACTGLRVEEALRHSELSPSTLKRRFEKLLGRSPKEEITRIRMEKAGRLLAETELPIAEVATRCGFSELKHLTRAFRAWAGTTPSGHRRQARKK
jgi:LacI family transcriptional regulator